MHAVLKSFFLLIFSTCTLALSAQGKWVNEPTITPGCNAIVTSSAKMANGDVIFGGSFTRCGAVRANRVVRFDGSNFHSVGAGSENGVDGTVRAVFVDAGKIYVGGHFKVAGSASANNIAVFENGEWHSVGSGLSNGVSGYVRAIQTFQGKLYVGGYDVIPSSYFAWQARLREWDGSTWRNVIDFDLQYDDGAINALTVDQSKLYFGGSFRPTRSAIDYNIGNFDGTTVAFQAFPLIGNNLGRTRVRDLHFFQNQLCVAGSFTLSTTPISSGVACLRSGEWVGFGSFYGMKALEDQGATLYAGGLRYLTPANVIAFGVGGISYFTATQPRDNDTVLMLVNLADQIIVGGQFAQQQPRSQNLMRIASGAMQPIAAGDAPKLNGVLSQMIVANANVYGVDYFSAFAAPLATKRIHQMMGGAWSEITQPDPNSEISGGLLVKNNTLYYSGGHSASPYSGLFIWNGFNWAEVGFRINADFIFQNAITRISSGPKGTRIVERLVGDVMQPFLVIPQLKMAGFALDDFVQLTLTEFRGFPVIAGSFDEMVGVGAVGSVAIYYENAWHPLGKQGLTNLRAVLPGGSAKFSVVEWQGQLYVSNGFTEADGVAVDGIARFDGTNWHSVGGGIAQSDPTLTGASAYLIPYQGKLYAYGNFDRAGRQPVNHVAQWDGLTWRTLGSGTAQGLGTDPLTVVNNAVVANGDLLFSGQIHEAGGEPADFFATWRASDLMFADSFE